MKAMHLFHEAVIDTIDAMHECGVLTVRELHDYEDANEHTERLFDYLTDLLWDDDNPDPGRDISISIVNAAQQMADLVMAEIESMRIESMR